MHSHYLINKICMDSPQKPFSRDLPGVFPYLTSGSLMLLLTMAIEIISFPIKKKKHGDVPVHYFSHYQRTFALPPRLRKSRLQPAQLLISDLPMANLPGMCWARGPRLSAKIHGERMGQMYQSYQEHLVTIYDINIYIYMI